MRSTRIECIEPNELANAIESKTVYEKKPTWARVKNRLGRTLGNQGSKEWQQQHKRQKVVRAYSAKPNFKAAYTRYDNSTYRAIVAN
ncbi:hypothetical protein Tco_1378972 [Tanacetum coccineum]